MPSKRVGQLSGFGDLLHRRRLFSGFEIQDGVLVLLPLRKSFSISFHILHVWLHDRRPLVPVKLSIFCSYQFVPESHRLKKVVFHSGRQTAFILAEENTRHVDVF